jgi:hypothetical protein
MAPSRVIWHESVSYILITRVKSANHWDKARKNVDNAIKENNLKEGGLTVKRIQSGEQESEV